MGRAGEFGGDGSIGAVAQREETRGLDRQHGSGTDGQGDDRAGPERQQRIGTEGKETRGLESIGVAAPVGPEVMSRMEALGGDWQQRSREVR